MKQFYAMKERYPDAVLFFQMGDFYETFGEDAEVVSRELEITLTSRGRDASGERMPLAGVPVHAAEGYIARLVRRGYRVAICDQVEDPKKAKGVVKRDVVRIVTPGTVIDAAMIGSSEPSYLMAVTQDGKGRSAGAAFLDISTGEFFVMEHPIKNGFTALFSEIARYNPSECVVPPEIHADIVEYLKRRGVVVTPSTREAFDEEAAQELLKDQFGVSSLEGFGCSGAHAAVAAAGACLQYAKATQKGGLSHINRLQTRHQARFMVLDEITMRNLELVRGVRNDSETTLLHLLDATETPMGSRLLRSFITRPLTDVEEINARLDAVEACAAAPIIRGTVQSQLHRCPDIERIAGRISYGNAGPRDLASLRSSLERIPGLKETFGESPPLMIAEALAGMHDLGAVAGLIARALVDDPPAAVKSGGIIREGYDAALDELRVLSRSGRTWIAEFQQQERERTGIRSLKVSYNKVFGYFIEVTRPNLRLVPEEYERRQTTANGERFTLPELKEKEALIMNAEERLNALESSLYTNLIGMLAKEVPALQETARAIGVVDVVCSLAEVARKNGYVRPVVEESDRLIIRDGRHPVVEQSLCGAYVPNDAKLDAAGEQILIITGANMAGKSTYMRTVALICVMAQMGSFVPANHATIGTADRIFTRVGAFDDLASGQSTFMVEMLELANILNHVTMHSLVILDEIGRGTSTADGYSIARAVLEFLHGRGAAGPRTLFATHFHELVKVESDLKRVRNFHFAVKDTGTEVVFLRKLIPGATDRSYGIHVAALAGIPRKVTGRAEEVLLEILRSEAGGNGRAAPRYTQMLLMDAPETEQKEHPIVAKLRELDLNMTTPLDALVLLHDLQREAGRGNGP